MPTSNSDLHKKIQHLSDDTQSRIRQTVTLAKERPVEGNEPWRLHLAALGLVPLTAVQIGELLQTGPKVTAGALPVELREALQKIKDDAASEMVKIENEIDAFEENDESDTGSLRDALENFDRFLNDVVDREVREYIQSTKPAVGLKGIFANAAATTPKYFEHAAKAGVKTLKCPACGAPRPADQTLETCAFCGTKLL